ncbi:cation:proton antiporter [Plantibacter sp. Mn2098]|uniref:cation:proton antiporter n=1 Tax=Plantibacter sp. Mn2098 TaxID=3395266 RepID=UPI003BD49D5E
METLIIIVLGLIAIAGATIIGPKVGVATPLLLVVVGIGVSFLPFIPVVEVEPEWILAGLLPPLLYSASVSMPSMEFRRELNAIGGLSIVLVVLSSVILGFFFSLVIPGLGIWWGIALGAVISPTDAVATSIVKRSGVSGRIVAVLEGESLLNDATALVLLRAAIAGAAASISLWGVVGNFLFAVAVAAAIGIVVGFGNLWLRSKVADSTVNTVISFTVPFLASIPAELLGASGLVAAVVAGLITGHGAARVLSPQHRVSDVQNWRTVELVLEGIIFLVMGLELAGIVADVSDEPDGLLIAVGVAAAALVITIVVRALYVAPLIALLRVRARRGERMKSRIVDFQERLGDRDSLEPDEFRRGRVPSENQLARGATRMRRALADIDYFLAAPLGWREGAVVVWAGMRGAVTLAAVQTLPETPHRSLLVLIAFIVAASSLLIQGGTLARVVRWVKPAVADPVNAEERERVMALLRDAAASVTLADVDGGTRVAAALEGRMRSIGAGGEVGPDEPDRPAGAGVGAAIGEDGGGTGGTSSGAVAEQAQPVSDLLEGVGVERDQNSHLVWKRLAIARINAQRNAILDARDDGAFSAGLLSTVLGNLDADQIAIERKGPPV